MKIKRTLISSLFGLFLLISIFPFGAHAESCRPTEPDMLGPFYKPDAPVRSSVGEGYVLHGTVRAAPECTPVANARVEFWLTGPDGHYNDEHRATLFSDAAGRYRFTSNFPQAYSGRPPHIHIRVSAENFKTLVTQHYPQAGNNRDNFDLVLRADY
jgi:protocatechuate 3,4-dioxygenase beta subunit